jgi:hypothetical protein
MENNLHNETDDWGELCMKKHCKMRNGPRVKVINPDTREAFDKYAVKLMTRESYV